MKPFNNRCRISLEKDIKKNDVFSELSSKEKYCIVKYLSHSSNNKTQEDDIYNIIHSYKNKDVFMVVENHMIEEILFENNKYYFIPISGIISFFTKPQ